MPKPTISFEFFPAKTDRGHQALLKTAMEYARLGPLFMSVTCGTDGTRSQEKTMQTALDLAALTHVPIASHLTFIDTPIEQLKLYTDRLWNHGIRHIIALRGDMPDDLQWPLERDDDYFQYTSDFVHALKSWHPFEVSVGAYPEKHPDSPSLALDMLALKRKSDAGADRAITQFFFDNPVYLTFAEACLEMGVHIPIVPGLLPIHNIDTVVKFAQRCQASVPATIQEPFEAVKNNPDAIRELSIHLLKSQAQNLIQNDVQHLHFYTLNKADIVIDVCRFL